ncbi:PilN domain-containing protein [Diaphorobacter aerolatus]|uniref:PilN domain-containing protein n=1 Tax=Diaphorobacter aerolatus TaxID=1288495 RepID=A0A7H0GNI3_9BURK|nr:PilN domain-containing protein [Diaphorobacter aerolatus]QNP49849.1 PilN domain-containing protein [Diaphorobacter aerolatus]
MILINLLPHREAARKRRKEAFQVTMVMAAVLGALIAGAVYMWYQNRIESQQERNAFLQREIKTLEDQIKEIASIEDEIAALRARQKAVEDLQADRNLPVYLLKELAAQLPDGIYVTGMKQTNQVVELQGMAQSNERVSELLRNLSGNTPWFAKPELLEIVAANATLSPKDVRRVASFKMRFQLMRSSDLKKDAESQDKAGTAQIKKGAANGK